MNNLFEEASRRKIRWNTSKGLLSVEDLWDLPLIPHNGRANLDDIARELYLELRNQSEGSFVRKTESKNEVLQLKFDIVKYIIDTKLVEAEAATNAQIKAEKKQKLMEILVTKENQELMNMTSDQLKDMLAQLS